MPHPNIAAARRFVDHVTKDENPSLQTLLRRLDELACSYHLTPQGRPADSDATPSCGARAGHEGVQARFPTLQYYRIIALEDEEQVLFGDPIDDIIDITNDLIEVLWRFKRVGPDDAHWHFRFLYKMHWGEHLRDLGRYLHWRLAVDEEEASAT